MRLGIASGLNAKTPKEWAEGLRRLGISAAVFPLDYKADKELIKSYADAARTHDIVIAEVGAWRNPISKDETVRNEAMEYCIGQLRLADEIGARCCLNISGSLGDAWDSACAENYSEQAWELSVKSIQTIIDEAAPKQAFYTVEPMPYMVPDSILEYKRLIESVDRAQFGVHMDVVNWIYEPKKYFFNREFMDEIFLELGSRIKSCHVKDTKLCEGLTSSLKECMIGEGNLDIEHYALLAHQCDENMPFIIEHLTTDVEYITAAGYVRERLHKAGIPMK